VELAKAILHTGNAPADGLALWQGRREKANRVVQEGNGDKGIEELPGAQRRFKELYRLIRKR
jgi:hypothetical protein